MITAIGPKIQPPQMKRPVCIPLFRAIVIEANQPPTQTQKYTHP
jgi:hypothetical protein